MGKSYRYNKPKGGTPASPSERKDAKGKHRRKKQKRRGNSRRY